jgi:hypothetical protein
LIRSINKYGVVIRFLISLVRRNAKGCGKAQLLALSNDVFKHLCTRRQRAQGINELRETVVYVEYSSPERWTGRFARSRASG